LKKIVLVGAGHAHVEVVRLFGVHKPAGVSVMLISEGARAGYSGMMPGVIAGHYARAQAEIDVPMLCKKSGIAWQIGTLARVHAAQNTLHTEAGAIGYDVLSLNTGSRPWLPDRSEGLHLGVKPFAAFLDALPALGKVKRIAVVGGGAAAVEVLFALDHRLKGSAQCALICATPDILMGYPKTVVANVKKQLHTCGAVLIKNARVESAHAHHLMLANGARVECGASVWATGARPHDYIASSDLRAAPDGFVAVNTTQQSLSHPNVFAVGDCATLEGAALPKAGLVPVRQGPWLCEQLVNAARGDPLAPFAFQRTSLALLALGDRYSVGSKGRFTFKGTWAWHWKDYIDRRFMAKYR
jgi:pyridine nucleotide-disulfide oxidoreductase family protein